MGYSNNKWRKVLTILMIINLCFILFAKIIKVFGVTTYSETLSSDIEIPDWLYNYNFRVMFYNNGSGYYAMEVTYLDKQYKLYYNQTGYANEYWRTLNNVNYHSFFKVDYKNNILSILRNLQTSQFDNQNGYNIFSYYKPTVNPKREYFYNFDVYSYQNQNEIVMQPNTSIIKYPEISNSLSDLESLNFDVISVNAWDWSNKDFDILFYDRNNVDTSTTEGLYPKRVITLNKNTPYYQETLSADPDKNAIFWIPIEETGLNFYIGGNYEIRLAERIPIQRRRWIS